jgi:hypothetical protein
MTAAGAGAGDAGDAAVGAEAVVDVDVEAAVDDAADCRVAGRDAVVGLVAATAVDVTATLARAPMRRTQARQRHLGFGVISMGLSA